MKIDYERLFQTVTGASMILDRDYRFLDANQAYCALVGKSREDLIGQRLFDAFPEAEHYKESVRAAFERSMAGETSTTEKQLYRVTGPDGKKRESYWTTSQFPLHDNSGRICGMCQRIEEVTEQVANEARAAWVSKELDHRVKNMLAIVSSIGRRTARSATDIDEFLERFDSRLGAMAGTHELLAQGDWEGMTLEALVRDVLDPFILEEGKYVSIEGDEVFLQPRDAQTLSLGIHELTTNAARYGAIADPQAKLKVRWSYSPHKDESYPCRIEWTESLTEKPDTPEETGFGSEVIDILMPHALNGEVKRELTETGLCCTIAFDPARHAVPAAQEG